MREAAKPGFIHKLIRLYTFHSPLKRGRNRLSNLAFHLSPDVPREIVAKTIDGQNLLIDTTNKSYKYVYFLGDYEAAISDIFRKIVESGDICFDIGANIGWYTTLFQKLVGPEGRVHSFEPIPPIFEHLDRNVRLNSPPGNVMLNNAALGNEEGSVDVHVFSSLPHGHSSIATFGYTDFETYQSKITTLDLYLSNHDIGKVSLVKMDVEGAELMVLKGAATLFEQKRPPVLEIEMALATTRGFGYLPNDLIEFIRSKADYDFYSIDESRCLLRQIHGFASDDIGANVLCLPREFDKRKLRGLFRSS